MLIVKYGSQKYTIEELTKETTLGKLKQIISTTAKIPISEQKLIFSGKQLLDTEKTLENFGIFPTSETPQTLLLVKQIDTSRSVLLFVRTIQRELDFRINIGISDKIETIRKMINEKVSLPSNYSLVYSGIVLQDSQTVLDYGIKERSSVYIVTQIVMEVENPTGERVKMRINDNRITGEVVERLVEQRRAVKSQRKRKHSSNSNEIPQTSSPTSISRPSVPSEESSFGGYRTGFLIGENKKNVNSIPTQVRKRTRTASLMESTTTFETTSGDGDGVTACTAITSSSPSTMVDPLTSNCNGTVTATANTTRVSIPQQTSRMLKVEEENLPSPVSSPSPIRKNVKSVIEEKKEEKPEISEIWVPLRCFKCSKKVGLTGIKCRCSQHFCSAHRYPEEHVCSFDYRSKAKEELTKANPKVESPKVIPIGK